MKKFLTLIVVFLLCASIAYAAVEIRSEGTKVGPTDKINLVGPSVSESGGVTTVDVTTITGDTGITGTITVSDDVYCDTGLSVDGSLYLTGGDGMVAPIIIRQPDGGCSHCGVDAAGTTFTCVDYICPAGMTQ